MLLTTLYKNPKLFWSALAICHLSLLVFLYLKFGLTIVNESDKYLSEAGDIANGDFKKALNYQVFYSAYILYLSVFVKLKLPTVLIFICTYVLSVFATYKFYKLITEFINEATARLWIIFIALSPMIQYWQLTLFSEIFFISISLLFFYVLLFKDLKYRLAKTLMLAVILLFTRPAGIFTMVCGVLTYCYVNRLFCKKNTIRVGVLLIVSIFITVIFFVKLHYKGIASQIAAGAVYYGFPKWDSPALPSGDYTLSDCYHFIITNHDVGELLKLNCHKFLSFFKLTRGHYTLTHNILNAVHYAFYIFSVIGLYMSHKKETKFHPFFVCLSVIILLNAIMISLFFNEWSERYTVVVFPFILLLAAYGIIELKHKSKGFAV